MPEEFGNRSHSEVEIEKIGNGYIVTTVSNKLYVKTFNGLTRALGEIFDDKLIYDKEQKRAFVNHN